VVVNHVKHAVKATVKSFGEQAVKPFGNPVVDHVVKAIVDDIFT